MKKSHRSFNIFVVTMVIAAVIAFEVILRINVYEVETRCMQAAEEICAPCLTRDHEIKD